MKRYLRPRSAFGIFIGIFVTLSGLLVVADSPQSVGTWRSIGASPERRIGSAAVALPDGRVLMAGGNIDGTASATVVVFDPADGSHTSIGSLLAPRAGHTATRLDDGRVLIAGGTVDGTVSADLELFDPATGSSILAASLAQPRTGHAAARLPDGTVLLAGGTGVDGVLDTAELFDPAQAAALPTPWRLTSPRTGASATALLDGRVLIAGGNNGTDDLASAEIFDPWTQVFELAPTTLSVARSGHTAVLLPGNNAVLIAGGSSNGVPQQASDLFLPAQFPDPFSYGIGAFAATTPLNQARAGAVGGPHGAGYAFVTGGGATDTELYRFATLETDKDDYAPGERAVITGSGWAAETEVTLLFQEDPAVHPDYELRVTSDAAGNIYWDQWAPEQHDLNVRFYLLAKQETPAGERRAQITFTDSSPTSATIAIRRGNCVAAAGTFNSGDTACVHSSVAVASTGNQAYRVQWFSPTAGSTPTFEDVHPLSGSGTFTFDDTHVVAVSGTWTVKGCGNSGCTGSNLLSTQTFTVASTQAATSLAVPAASGTYGTTVNLQATLTSGGSGVANKSIAFTLNGAAVGSASTNASGVASLTGISLGAITAGGYPTGIGAAFAGDSSFLASTGTGALTVGKANQAALTVSVPSPGVYNQTYTLTAAGGSGTGAVTYSVAGSDACTVSGDQLTMTKGSGGTCAVTATKAADTNYNQISSASTPVTLSKANQATVTVAAPPSALYGQSGLSASASGGSGTGAFNYSAGASTACAVNASSGSLTISSGTGTCSITATRAGDANYNDSAASAAASVTIAKAAANVSVSGYTGVYDANAHGASGSATGVGGADLSASLSLGATFTDVPGGTAHWTFSGGANYEDQNGDAAIVINKAHATVAVNGYSGTYDAHAHGATGSASGVGGVDLSGSLNLGSSFTDAPGGTAHWTFAGGTNYEDQSGDAAIVINKANQTITWATPADIVYGTVLGAAQLDATVSGIPGGTAPGALTYSPGAGVRLSAGSASLTATAAATANYNEATKTVTITVRQLPVTLTGTRQYDGTVVVLNTILSVSNAQSGDSVGLASGAASIDSKDVGSRAISSFGTLALGGAQAANYTLVGASGSVLVTARQVYLTGARPYDGTTDAAAAILSIANTVGGDDVAVVSGVGTLASKEVGVRAITSFGTLTLGGTAAGNYTTAGGAGSVTITPWTVTGFYQPVTMSGPSVLNSIKGGQTVPLKFNIYVAADGPQRTDVAAIQGFRLTAIACSDSASVDVAPDFSTTGDTQLRYDGTQFIQNWASPKGANRCYEVMMTAADGSTIKAYFKTR